MFLLVVGPLTKKNNFCSINGEHLMKMLFYEVRHFREKGGLAIRGGGAKL